MTSIIELNRHFMRQADLGKGLRLTAQELDLLIAIGVGELLASKAADSQREQCQKRMMRSIPGADTGSNGTLEPMEPSGRHSSRSSGTMPPPGETGAEARARRRSAPQKTRSTGSISNVNAAKPAAQHAGVPLMARGAAQ
ncbi:MAG: hypothetical protein ACOY7T_03015 [Pseudomonadota bacterium]